MGRFGILAVFLVGVLACVPERPEGGAPRLGMMPKLVGIPYFNACRRGAEEAAREAGELERPLSFRQSFVRLVGAH